MTSAHNVLYLVYNENGDVTADMNRDAAIERLRDDFGGDIFRVVEMTVDLPGIPDMKAEFVVPVEKAGPVIVQAQ